MGELHSLCMIHLYTRMKIACDKHRGQQVTCTMVTYFYRCEAAAEPVESRQKLIRCLLGIGLFLCCFVHRFRFGVVVILRFFLRNLFLSRGDAKVCAG